MPNIDVKPVITPSYGSAGMFGLVPATDVLACILAVSEAFHCQLGRKVKLRIDVTGAYIKT